jgi:hypothetical protein
VLVAAALVVVLAELWDFGIGSGTVEDVVVSAA